MSRVREVTLIEKSMMGIFGACLNICVDAAIPQKKEEAVWAWEGEHIYFEYIDDLETVKDLWREQERSSNYEKVESLKRSGS